MNHALLGAPEPPRTAHEWVDFTIEHAALQGPGGVALGALLSAVGLDAPALAPQRRAVARVLESGARGARAAAGADPSGLALFSVATIRGWAATMRALIGL